ncbi:MAG: hypothetical protein Q8N23_27450 [Archangium sp.]|nr:hypothetical protein [Archangium sp.]MDP3156443.1 hypothetical protein [Archangium sp.]MDP3573111.1 hypothetical protein [Archangium sp.]
MRTLWLLVAVWSFSGCALGVGRVSASPSALSNNDGSGVIDRGDGTGTVVAGGSVDTGDGFHLGLLAGVKVGRAFGFLGTLPFANGWAWDAHVDLMGSSGGWLFGLSGSYLMQSLEFTGDFRAGYFGPAASALVGLCLTPGLAVFVHGGPTFGAISWGNTDSLEKFGSAMAIGGRAQIGADLQLVKSDVFGFGVRLEGGLLATGPSTVHGQTAAMITGNVMAEIAGSFAP